MHHTWFCHHRIYITPKAIAETSPGSACKQAGRAVPFSWVHLAVSAFYSLIGRRPTPQVCIGIAEINGLHYKLQVSLYYKL